MWRLACAAAMQRPADRQGRRCAHSGSGGRFASGSQRKDTDNCLYWPGQGSSKTCRAKGGMAGARKKIVASSRCTKHSRQGGCPMQRPLPGSLRQPARSAILTWLTAGSMQADSRTHAALAILQQTFTHMCGSRVSWSHPAQPTTAGRQAGRRAPWATHAAAHHQHRHQQCYQQAPAAAVQRAPSAFIPCSVRT